MGRSVSEAADKAVQKSKKIEKMERTREQRLKDIRGLLAAKLAVTPDDTRFLLEELDKAEAQVLSTSVKLENLEYEIIETNEKASLE